MLYIRIDKVLKSIAREVERALEDIIDNTFYEIRKVIPHNAVLVYEQDDTFKKLPDRYKFDYINIQKQYPTLDIDYEHVRGEPLTGLELLEDLVEDLSSYFDIEKLRQRVEEQLPSDEKDAILDYCFTTFGDRRTVTVMEEYIKDFKNLEMQVEQLEKEVDCLMKELEDKR